MPRPQPLTSLATLAIAASALLLPLSRVTVPAAFADSPSLISLERLSHHFSESTFEIVYTCTVAFVLLLAALLPRAAAWSLAGVVGVGLVAGSLIASREIRDRSQTERERTFAGAPADWIDATVAKDVALLLTGERLWPSAWETLFWKPLLSMASRAGLFVRRARPSRPSAPTHRWPSAARRIDCCRDL